MFDEAEDFDSERVRYLDTNLVEFHSQAIKSEDDRNLQSELKRCSGFDQIKKQTTLYLPKIIRRLFVRQKLVTIAIVSFC